MYGRRYRKDDADLEELLRGLIVLVVVGSLALFFADRTLFFKVVAGAVVLIILIVVGAIVWGRHKARKFDERYDAIAKSYGSVQNNFIDQFGRAKGKRRCIFVSAVCVHAGASWVPARGS